MKRDSSSSGGGAYSATSIVHSLGAGYAAGFVGSIVGHPLDSAKVWLQTAKNPVVGSSASPAVHSPSISATAPASSGRHMSTVALETPRPRLGLNLQTVRALYSGIGVPIITVGLVQSANFAIYDSVRRVLHKRDFPDAAELDYLEKDSLLNVAASSMVAGSVLAFFTSPFIILKTKQQIMDWSFQKAFRDTLSVQRGSRRPAVSNFYVGFGPHFTAECFGRGFYFYCYEGLKRACLERKRKVGGDDESLTLSLHERMMSAALSGILCWTFIFPVDALRSRMYAQSLSMDSKTSWQLARDMYRESQSLRPFYRGFSVTVMRAGPVAAAVLPVYDTTLAWLSKEQ